MHRTLALGPASLTLVYGMNTVEIRSCLPGEAPQLTAIAHASKRHWGYPERWIEEWRESLTVTPDLILSSEVHGAAVEGELVGFYVLMPVRQRMELEHFWLVPEHIGSGLGKALFRHAVGVATSRGTRVIDITSDPNAEGFYRKMGATPVGRVFAPVDGEQRYLPRLELRLEGPPGGVAEPGRPNAQGPIAMMRLTLSVIDQPLAVCRLEADAALPQWIAGASFVSCTRTADELSVVAADDRVPDGVRCERGWRALKVEGPLDFSLTGVLASLATPLAEAAVSIFALSTFDTDYLLVKSADLDRALSVLANAGHRMQV